MDFPAYRMPVPPILTTYHPDCFGFRTGSMALDAGGSATWQAANTAYFYPFRLTDWGTAYQLLFLVGATSSGNLDMGIYDSQKNKIVSAGSTAMSGSTNTVQELNITDTVLAPGDYLLAAAVDNTTATCWGQNLNDEIGFGVGPYYQQGSLTAAALTDPAVPVNHTGNPRLLAIGIQFRSVF